MTGDYIKPTPPTRTIRVLLAEDSATVRAHLTTLIEGVGGMRVIGEARDGEEAIVLAAQLKPDVVSMDINMPNMNGLDATRHIMMEQPVPVVVVSNLLERNVELAFEALQAGALAVVEKPPHRESPGFNEKRLHLIKTLIAMSAVKVIRRGRTGMLASAAPTTPTRDTGRLHTLVRGTGLLASRPAPIAPELIAIGASAGGPSALATLLRGLPEPPALRVPVVIVQHMAQEFIPGLARWLANASGKPVRVATDGNSLMPGVVHLSPGTAHMTVVKEGGILMTRLLKTQGVYRYQPSIDVLFQSVAETCGATAIGLILTGMGDDGADGLLTMRRMGARTFAQDPASATVYGMPGAAIERGAVEMVDSLANLATAVTKLL